MKKILAAVLTLALGATVLAGCGTKAENVITVGASITPHAVILDYAKTKLAEKGYELEIIEYNDYVLPNTATQSGEIDANFFQHAPYLENFNKEQNTNLVSVANIHYEPFGLYAGKTKSLNEIKDGAIIAIPNDGSNEARALLLLQSLGYITLNDGVEFTATVLDIKTNPKNLDIKELEAAQLPRSLADVDFAIINGNYAIGADLKISDALAAESDSSNSATTYANILVVKEGNENNPGIKALIEVLKSEDVTKFINDTFSGAVVPIN